MLALLVMAVSSSLLLMPAFVWCSDPEKGKHNLTLVVMAPFPGELTEGWDAGPALIPAAVVAAEEINNSTDILPDFNLQLVVADSGCSITAKVYVSFFRDIFENDDHQVVGIIGPGCSGAALVVSNLTSRYELSLIHITPGATTPELEDSNRNTTYATVSSSLSYVQSLVHLIEYNNWTKIATLQDEGRLYFKQTHSGFMKTVDSGKVVFTDSLLSGEMESFIPLESLRSSQAKVFIVFAGSQVAGELLCYAFHKKMTYPSYQWVFHDRTADDFIKNVTNFRVDGTTFNCSRDEMVNATQGVTLNQFHPEQENQTKILPYINKTFKEYKKEYELKLNGVGNYTPYSNSYHDAVWAMALALHNASLKSGVDLTSYTYNRNNDTREIAKHLNMVDFDGVSGPITFREETRSVETIINIKQLWDGKASVVGTFDRSRREKLLLNLNQSVFIRDVFDITKVRIHTALGVLVIILAVLLAVVIALLHLAHTVWYGQRSIKASSPNISHLIFSGCYLFLIFLIAYSVQESFGHFSFVLHSVICNGMMWCLVLGFSLVFGTLCAKAWRVHRLFIHFRNQSPSVFLTDNALILSIVCLLFFDLAIGALWNMFDPLMLTPRLPVSEVTRVHCSCMYWSRWIGSIVAYKAIILVFLTAVLILNRRIKRKNFKHTKSTTILVYSVFLIGCIGIPLYFLLKQKSIYIGFLILCTIALSTVSLCCLTIFLPPVLIVLKSPREGPLKRGCSKQRRRSSEPEPTCRK